MGNQHLQQVLRSLARPMGEASASRASPAKAGTAAESDPLVARLAGGGCGCCASCSHKETPSPGKALEEELVADEGMDKPDPHNGGAATIQCNGKGGYEVVLNGYAGATCGTKDCVVQHESSHMADWKAKWPDGCKGQPQGYLPKGDPPDKPLMTVQAYRAFLKDSECRAHGVDLLCAKALPKEGACKATVEAYITLTKNQKKNWC